MTTQSVIIHPFQLQTEHGERIIKKALKLVENDPSYGGDTPILTHFVASVRLMNLAAFFSEVRRQCSANGDRTTCDPRFGIIDRDSAEVASIELCTRAAFRFLIGALSIVVPIVLAFKVCEWIC